MNPIASLKTSRLTLRPLQASDAEFIVRLLNDPAFIRFIGDRKVRSIQDAERYIAEGPQKSYAAHAVGLLLVQQNYDDAPIGLCGLLKRDYLSHPDIGFALLPQFTGSGYAYEAARAVIDDAIGVRKTDRILAIVQADNASSRALLTKLGLSETGTVRTPDTGEELLLYALTVNQER